MLSTTEIIFIMASEPEITQCWMCGKDIKVKEAYRLKIERTIAPLYICESCIKENPGFLEMVAPPEVSD